MRRDAPLRLALKTLAWLPACLLLWYFTGAAQSAFLAGPAGMLVNAVDPGLVTHVEHREAVLAFETSVRVLEQDRLLQPIPEVDTRIYTCGIPLFLALMLAARSRWWMIAGGILALFLLQCFGIAADCLVQVGVRMGPGVAERAGIGATQREMLALAYQFGSLILPMLAPVALWLAFNPAILRRAAASDAQAGAGA